MFSSVVDIFYGVGLTLKFKEVRYESYEAKVIATAKCEKTKARHSLLT